MAESSASFTIVHRDRSGKPDFVYPWDGELASLVVASINVCRGMLRDPKIRSAFVSFAREYNRLGSVPQAWYCDPYYGYKSMEDVVNTYIEVILASFPIVYIDDSITSPNCLAACPRRPWIDHFQPRDQSILLNGPRVRDMVAAASRAEQTNGRGDYENKRFRTFIFLWANTILHELGHTLITFLNRGGGGTPPHIKPEVPGYSSEYRGEAGRTLETILFGGVMQYYQDIADDDSQPGIPHILTRHGIRRVSQASIDDTVRYRFHSPYHFDGPLIDPRTMQVVAANYPRARATDPMEWIEMDQFRRYGRRVYVGPQSALYRLPFHPDFRAQAV